MPQSRLPQGGENLFQAIKEVRREAELKGMKLINLSIGQPLGPAAEPARAAAALAVLSDRQAVHEYQDNGSDGVPDFSARFIGAHLPIPGFLSNRNVAYLPIPGIKPMLGLVQLACGESLARGFEPGGIVTMTTNPGYPTPRDQAKYQRIRFEEPELSPQNDFLVPFKELSAYTRLLMTNYPHNPSGQVATRDYWEELCRFCQERGIRLFNDAAYAALVDSGLGCTLSEVAVGFPDLSWTEAFSASKLSNLTGWRIGGMVGSPDFIGDIATIKGNTDSGFAAPLAAGVLDLVENFWPTITVVSDCYRRRREELIAILETNGMQLAVKPKAGFFVLCLVPNFAFDQEIHNAQEFNFLMIERAGLVGVHFNPGFIRYAVTGPVEEMVYDIHRAFKSAQVGYR